MYAFGVGLKYANLSNIMLGISNSSFQNTNSSFQNTNSSFENTNSSFENTNSSFENTNSKPLVTITLYAYILDILDWCVSLFHLLLTTQIVIFGTIFLQVKIIGGRGGGLEPPLAP